MARGALPSEPARRFFRLVAAMFSMTLRNSKCLLRDAIEARNSMAAYRTTIDVVAPMDGNIIAITAAVSSISEYRLPIFIDVVASSCRRRSGEISPPTNISRLSKGRRGNYACAPRLTLMHQPVCDVRGEWAMPRSLNGTRQGPCRLPAPSCQAVGGNNMVEALYFGAALPRMACTTSRAVSDHAAQEIARSAVDSAE